MSGGVVYIVGDLEPRGWNETHVCLTIEEVIKFFKEKRPDKDVSKVRADLEAGLEYVEFPQTGYSWPQFFARKKPLFLPAPPVPQANK